MPELPEVQTIVDDLNRKIRGWDIADFWTDWDKSIKVNLEKFKKNIIGKRIKKAGRRGKNILVFLSEGLVIHIHLKMTGHLLTKFLIPNLPNLPNKFPIANSQIRDGKYFKDKVNGYIRHAWLLKKGNNYISLEFSDLRKFGKIRLLDEKELKRDKELNNLGIESLSDELTLARFSEILRLRKNKSVRDILMDQSLVAGIGNIYASEILFEAGILPARKADGLSEKEIKSIFNALKKVLKKALRFRGTSDSDYRDTAGAPGGFQKVLKVYNREKELCKRSGCEGVVRREKIKQRSAFYCEGCQV